MRAACSRRVLELVTAPDQLGGHPLRLVYLRRKPERGLVALHGDGEGALACVSLDEAAVQRDDGVPSVVWFPHDDALPSLRACCDPLGEPRAAAGVRHAAALLGARDVLAARVEPLRYKPGDRCVLRYRLDLVGGDGAPTTASVIGKVYRSAPDAVAAHAAATHLEAHAAAVVPRPLALVTELGLTLSEDVSARAPLGGASALRARPRTPPPTEALCRAGALLAAIHATPAPAAWAVRSADDAARQACSRGALLVGFAPGSAARTRATAAMVAQALTGHARPPSTPCHGSFKPSQLLLGPAAAVVTDLDHACVAEPALDVGCFLAYLRPAAVWRRRCTRARAWYDHAAGVFSAAYARGMEAAGAGALGRVALERAPAYEGALILKIAARRPHRLQSLRPLELSAMLDEAAQRAVGEGRR